MDASLICLVLGLIGLVYWVIEHQKREILIGPYGRRISRTRDPIEFWIAHGFHGAMVLVLLLVPVLVWSGLLAAIVDRG